MSVADLAATPIERLFSAQRGVRVTDTDLHGQVRIDALVRYAQDIASDDIADAGMTGAIPWIARKTTIEVRTPAHLREKLTITTACDGVERMWARRRVDVAGSAGASATIHTVWVHVDLASGRPAPIDADFARVFTPVDPVPVSIRLTLPTSAPVDASRLGWSVRFSDLDVMAHANNSNAGQIIEQVLAVSGGRPASFRADIDYRVPLAPDLDATVLWTQRDDGVDLWVFDDGDRSNLLLAARVRTIGD